MQTQYFQLKDVDEESNHSTKNSVFQKLTRACKLAPRERYYTLVYATMACVLGSFLVAAPLVLPYLQDSLDISASQSSLVYSLCYIGLIIGSTLSGPILSQTKLPNTHSYFIFSAMINCSLLLIMLVTKSYVLMLGLWLAIGIGLGTIRSSLSVYCFRISAFIAVLNALSNDNNKDLRKDSENDEDNEDDKDKNMKQANRGAIMWTRINFVWDLCAAIFAATFDMNHINIFWYILIGLSIIYSILLYMLPTPPVPALLVEMDLDKIDADGLSHAKKRGNTIASKKKKTLNKIKRIYNKTKNNNNNNSSNTDKHDSKQYTITLGRGQGHEIITPTDHDDHEMDILYDENTPEPIKLTNNFKSTRNKADSMTVSYDVVSQVLSQTQTGYAHHLDNENDSRGYARSLRNTIASMKRMHSFEPSSGNINGMTPIGKNKKTTMANATSVRASFEISQIAVKESIAIEKATRKRRTHAKSRLTTHYNMPTIGEFAHASPSITDDHDHHHDHDDDHDHDQDQRQFQEQMLLTPTQKPFTNSISATPEPIPIQMSEEQLQLPLPQTPQRAPQRSPQRSPLRSPQTTPSQTTPLQTTPLHTTPSQNRSRTITHTQTAIATAKSLEFEYKHGRKYIYLLLTHFFFAYLYEAFLVAFATEYCINELDFNEGKCVTIGSNLIALESWGKFASGVFALIVFKFVSFYRVVIFSQCMTFLAMVTFVIFQLVYVPPFGLSENGIVGSLSNDVDAFVYALYVIYFILGFDRSLGVSSTYGIVEPVSHVTPLMTVGFSWLTSAASAIGGYGIGSLFDSVGYDLMPILAFFTSFLQIIVIFVIALVYRDGVRKRDLFLQNLN